MKKESTTILSTVAKTSKALVDKSKKVDTKYAAFLQLFSRVYDRMAEAKGKETNVVEFALCDGEREFYDKLVTEIRKYPATVAKVAQTRDFIVLQINLTP